MSHKRIFFHHSPFNKGQIFAKACTGPKRVYCPIENSMKRRGTPQSPTMMRYGIMKAPESKGQQRQWFAYILSACESILSRLCMFVELSLMDDLLLSIARLITYESTPLQIKLASVQ